MKKLVVLTMVMAVFIGIPVCVLAIDEPRDASAFCNAYAAGYPDSFALFYRNLGECVNLLKASVTPKDDPALYQCRFWRLLNPEGYETFFETQGLGPCIKYFRELPPY